MSSHSVNDSRFKWVAWGSCGLFAVAVFSQFRVQAFGSGEVIAKAKETKRFIVSIKDEPKRGRILSADGKVLARDEGAYELNIQFKSVPHSDGFFLDLGAATGISGAEFAELAARGGKNQSWRTQITGDQKRQIDAIKTKWRADGLSVKVTGQRAYPMGDEASSIVGMFRDQLATKGLERSFDKYLTGVEGVSTGLVDRTGAFLPMRMDGTTVKRKDGADVQLTIDSDLQRVASESVRKAVEGNKADSGIAIVMDPKTGNVLAMANWPSYDPATGQGPNGKPADVNPAIMSRFEPGSTMKILTLAKALDMGVIDESFKVNCEGTLRIGPYHVACVATHGLHHHGVCDTTKAIAESCNVSAATWATKIGFDSYLNFIEDMDLVKKGDVGLPFQVSGAVFVEPVAKLQELMCWGFGQSVSVTPISLASAFTAIGNNGVRMEPRLIARVDGKETPIKAGKQVFKADTTERVLHCMESVLDDKGGTGHKLQIAGYTLAGKTGTAQRLGRGQGYVANFVGFVPSQQPRAMVLVMIDHPTGDRWHGADVAGPVFSELAHAIIGKYAIAPTSGTTTAMTKPSATVEVKPR